MGAPRRKVRSCVFQVQYKEFDDRESWSNDKCVATAAAARRRVKALERQLDTPARYVDARALRKHAFVRARAARGLGLTRGSKRR